MFGTLMKRDILNIWRNPLLFKSRLMQFIFLGLYLGGVFFALGKDDYTVKKYWSGISGCLFELNISFLMSSLGPTALTFPVERAVFLKEENSRLYGVLPYFLSRSAIEIPYLILMPMIYVLIFYWMVGLSSTA